MLLCSIVNEEVNETRVATFMGSGASIPIPSGRCLRPVKKRGGDTISTTTTIINRKCSNCTTVGQLFLRKVIDIDVTRCLDFSSKCTKNVFGGAAWRSPDPLGELTALPRPPSWIQGVLLLGGGEGREVQREGKARARGGEGKEGREGER